MPLASPILRNLSHAKREGREEAIDRMRSTIESAMSAAELAPENLDERDRGTVDYINVCLQNARDAVEGL